MAMPAQDVQPELALLARMKQGDEAAFVLLYRGHRDKVYRLALAYCGSSAHAADVTQETFIHFITQPGQYNPLRGTLGAWLCGVARNMARKALGGREDATDPDELADDSAPHEAHIDRDTPLEHVLRGEAAEQVRRAVAALAPHYGQGQVDGVDDSGRRDRQPQRDQRHVGKLVFARAAGDGVLALQRPAHRRVDLPPRGDQARRAAGRPLQGARRLLHEGTRPGRDDARSEAAEPTRLKAPPIIEPFHGKDSDMGRGDKRSFKGKVFKGSHGKTRLKNRENAKAKAAAIAAASKKK
jgi:RNA polymerase sigma-70 factor, ECF subfamily